ncbi:MAG: DUF2804 domain-containing protein [Deltaproteobacteria bacterium]|nr:DUF2804 domain-containing protein [Deltaproteobacteria bacterium]
MADEPALCPESLVDPDAAPRLGAFSGRMRDTSLERLGGGLKREGWRRLASEKRWHYACVASPELFVGGAIVQLGYLASAFLYVFDRPGRRMLAQHSFLLPPPLVEIDDLAAEARATMRRVRSRMLIEASASAGRFSADLYGGRLAVEIALRPGSGPAALTAVCPVAGGGVTMTQKTVCLPAEGEVRVGDRVLKVEGALAALDYSHGYLGRETRWRWASASGRLPDGRPLGLNLVEGHNDGAVTENALWIGSSPTQPGRAHFELDESDPSRPWRVSTDDGRVDLRFLPEGLRGEDRDLKIIASQYVQPMGTFEGVVRDSAGETIEIAGVPGVMERHRVRW